MENLLLELAPEPTESLAELADRQEVPVLQKCDCQGVGTLAIANRRTQIKTSVTGSLCQQ
jgi:hypothetical protein